MNTSKIIRAVVGSGRYTETAAITKEDYGRILKIEGIELPETYEIDFSNDRKEGTSVTMIGNADGVLIPQQFIKSGKDIYAFYYHVGENYGKTTYIFHIPNRVRPDRTNEEPEPEQQSVIDQAISALNDAVEATEQSASDAAESAEESAQSAENAAQSASQAAESAQGAEEYATRAEAAQSAAESAQTAAQTAAATAAQKASQATAAESAAASAAQTATAKAIEAAQIVEGVEGYAESAAASASQAQTSAQTASTKASEASQSASTASAKATEATTAAGSANTAKIDAVAAKTAAETAKTAAETAQGAAEDAAESVSASAAQIAQNTSDISSVKEDLNDKAPIILETASGSIASFSDGADNMPMKSLLVNIDPVQSGSGDPSPDNVRPISGWTGVTAQRTGKNLLDSVTAFGDATSQYTVNQNGSITVESSDSRAWTAIIPVPIKSGTYTLSRGTANGWVDIRLSTEDYSIGHLMNASMTSATFTVSEDGFYKIKLGYSASSYPFTAEVQLELASTATSYEPYQGNTYSVDWQTEAGTVYGGTIDVISGELVVDRAMVDLGTLNYGEWGSTDSVTQYYTTALDQSAKNWSSGISSVFAYNISKEAWAFYISNGSSGKTYFRTPKDHYNSITEFKTAMNGVQLVYVLATPITYHLTPHEVTALLGSNNVWADTGDVSVEYRADTKLYIQRLTQPDTADMIADANITSGQYFMVGNTLYKATANIASGATISPNVNCTRKSLSEALNEINA